MTPRPILAAGFLGLTGLAPAVAADLIPACTLVTLIEASDIVGRPMGQATEQRYGIGDAWGSSCSLTPSGGAPSQGVSLRIDAAPDGADPGTLYAATQRTLAQRHGPWFELTPVAGLGAISGWDGIGKALYVFTSRYEVTATAGASQARDEREIAVELARTALSRLPDD